MDPQYFNSRNLSEKTKLIVLRAEYLSLIKRNKYCIKLYTADYEYIEVYHSQQTDVIVKIQILSPKNKRLNLYAVAVNLSDLYKQKDN